MTGFSDGLTAALGLWPLVMIALGTFVGISVGAIPGLTGAMVIALVLPMTYVMQSTDALFLLVAIYVGAVSGGLITATLLEIPGTPASMVTTFDAAPLAKQGHSARALGLGISASFCGGLISWVFLATLSPLLASVSLRFGSYEYFGLTLLALLLIVSVGEGGFLKSLIAGLLGILTALPGLDPVTGQLRLTWGFDPLSAGFDLLAVLIGVFAVARILEDVAGTDKASMSLGGLGGILLLPRDYIRHGWNMIRSSIIGTWIGILPGVGGNIGSIVAYSVARNVSSEREKFGKGSEEGIVASEAANNATVNGALIPLITLGIPGSVVDAILIGAFFIHNLQPGPLLFTNNPEIAYGIIVAALIANIMMFIMMLAGGRVFIRLASLQQSLLIPAILTFCFIGAYAVHNGMDGVWVMLAFGLVGYFMTRTGLPMGPYVIGLVLAPMSEKFLRSSLMHSGGEIMPFFTRPISLGILIVAGLSFSYSLYREFQGARNNA